MAFYGINDLLTNKSKIIKTIQSMLLSNDSNDTIKTKLNGFHAII